MRRTPPPVWFVVLAAAVYAAIVASLDGALAPGGSAPSTDAPPALAFWPIIGAIVSAIWTGVQVAAKVTLAALSWSVKWLWIFATKVYDFAKGVGAALWKGLRESWEFLETTYERVLKPAWDKFWKFVESAKKWLDKHVGPILRFLQKVRDRILKFYEKWIRPILDTIGVARRVLDVLARLGVEWARSLDQKLAALESWIDEQFRRVLAEVNRVIDVVNRVVTADGLFQRLALIRSIERDVLYVSRAFTSWRSNPLTPAEHAAMREAAKQVTVAQVVTDAETYYRTRGGPAAALIDELAAEIRATFASH